MADPSYEPRSIKILDSGLEIVWSDEHLSLLPHRFLRGHCGCAGCVDEWTHQRRVGIEQVAADVKAEDMLEIGNYAVEILWSDLHYEGIYPFRVLRALCQCSICLADSQAQV
jgi:DUF971 family protein